MNMTNYSDLMEELRTEYLESFKDKFKTIEDFFKAEDWYSLELEYHKLKGTGTTYGAPEVTEICTHMEKNCQNKSENLNDLVKLSISLLSKTREKYLEEADYELSSDPEFKLIQS